MKAAAVAAVAVLSLTACGPLRVGAAALVGDHRIATSSLDQAAREWQREIKRNPQASQAATQFMPDPDSPPRSVLAQLIGFRVWNEAARQQRVSVSSADVDRAVTVAFGGQANLDTQTLAGGLPVRYGRDLARSAAIQLALFARFGVVPDAQGQVDQQRLQLAQQPVNAMRAQAARSLGVKVNPRYGAYDPRAGNLAVVTYGLSRPESGTGSTGPRITGTS